MINIIDKLHDINLHIGHVKEKVEKILGVLDYADYDIGIQFTTPAKMQAYNKEFRGKNKVTDVLSFPYHKLKPGERVMPKKPEDKNLGDIIICPEYVKENLKCSNQTLEQRLTILLVHGICHLLGYDHTTDEEYEVMKKEEEYLLSKIQK